MIVYLGYLLLLVLVACDVTRGEAIRKAGDRVFVTSDNMGSGAIIIEVRESRVQPPSHYKVRMDIDGQEFWAFDYEVSDE